jgi:hypothetical protein
MAGVSEAESLIIVKKERSFSNEEQALEDCNTILTVQYIFRFSTFYSRFDSLTINFMIFV